MKRKILGLCFLSVLCLNFSTIALAEENQIESSQQITQSSSTTDSTASVPQIESQTTGNSDYEQTTDSVETEAEEVTVPQSQMETAEGTMSLPKGRSDLYPSIQLFASLPSVSATNTNTPSKSFIDISSHNGNISVANFQKMKGYGVTGVVVKLTEATSYTNPYAQSQINNAMAAGMKVSAYHYSWFTSDAQAEAEANYFAAAAKKFGLSSGTVMVNDIEEPQILGKGNHTNNSRAFENRLKNLGYGNVRHYIGLNWLDTGRINASTIGYKNIWVAAYPYNLSTTNFYTQYGAWQWSSQLSFPGISGNFDINADYTSTFSNPTPTPPANSVQMYRVYNPNSGEHFYTQNVAEKNNLVSKGWRYEGIGWNGPTSGNPVYRLYNPNAGDHHYTLHAYEKDNLIKKGWRYEGISWYSGGPNALHRLYNPNAKAGAHHYTLNTNEKNNLVKHGWKYEGLAWYAK
ncbi:GH25 family lysozyme [Enterococcus raffinosus]|uniref:GH25 family lysozyme n=1 Tax=Enterococcus raffinosus TaxID=71452 RepID=A0AAW8TCA4_9ENTE|nr:GH25 family lysozyme [Enterococcus raffinosus]MDT2522762.1 GH25 family lysozyme [Enterococcus raffinosus]MDT2531132.1 GH25 family lysozyme [Enterococcus raffinosus]MDT2532551.1 GH25 family lysozyme [Enterococcus raffinosus]MDT2546214.1 GH25 family lysozyme [Enterococcus raffinosus]MDT2554566.1 GH25 family lysozyme [Enterococcus raffinosus]